MCHLPASRERSRSPGREGPRFGGERWRRWFPPAGLGRPVGPAAAAPAGPSSRSGFPLRAVPARFPVRCGWWRVGGVSGRPLPCLCVPPTPGRSLAPSVAATGARSRGASLGVCARAAVRVDVVGGGGGGGGARPAPRVPSSGRVCPRGGRVRAAAAAPGGRRRYRRRRCLLTPPRTVFCRRGRVAPRPIASLCRAGAGADVGLPRRVVAAGAARHPARACALVRPPPPGT